MIQRIQTVFLALALLSSAALIFTSSDVDLFGSFYIVSAAAAVSALLSAIAIFSYKNRPRQIMFNNLNIFINALLIGLLAYWLLNLSGGIQFPEKGIEPLFSLISIICQLLANIYIRKDERLVKSVDRLR